MALYQRCGEKRKSVSEVDSDSGMDFKKFSEHEDRSGKAPDTDKRMRREIANSNERRRMQSINAGFQSLKAIIPCTDREKLSKAAILQQTTEHVNALEQTKTKLMSQNAHLRQLLKQHGHRVDENSLMDLPPCKRKKTDTESSDEGISLGYEENSVEEMRKEVIALRKQLESERKLRMIETNRRRDHEAQAKRLKQFAAHMQNQIRHSPVQTYIKEEPIEPVKQLHALPTKQNNAFSASMSSRNLETIVEAIRLLEGDHFLCDRDQDCSHIPQSEESQNESGSSDQEDSKSESSGRDSPFNITTPIANLSASTTATLHINTSHIMAPHAVSPELVSHLYRPAVIMQKTGLP